VMVFYPEGGEFATFASFPASFFFLGGKSIRWTYRVGIAPVRVVILPLSTDFPFIPFLSTQPTPVRRMRRIATKSDPLPPFPLPREKGLATVAPPCVPSAARQEIAAAGLP